MEEDIKIIYFIGYDRRNPPFLGIEGMDRHQLFFKWYLNSLYCHNVLSRNEASYYGSIFSLPFLKFCAANSDLLCLDKEKVSQEDSSYM